MPQAGAHLLSEVTSEKIEITCSACARRGVLTTANLRERYGDIGMPDLLMTIAKAAGCPKANDPNGLEYCKAVYAPGSLIWKP